MLCPNCKKNHDNPKYCSRSCAATYSNKLKPKRQRTRKCIDCNTFVLSDRKRCTTCRKSSTVIDYILGDVKTNKQHARSVYNTVRFRARSLYPKGPCEKCGYALHTEICHIKPISSFPLETRISIINDKSNLIRLCPNCHWELDHKMVILPRLELG